MLYWLLSIPEFMVIPSWSAAGGCENGLYGNESDGAGAVNLSYQTHKKWKICTNRRGNWQYCKPHDAIHRSWKMPSCSAVWPVWERATPWVCDQPTYRNTTAPIIYIKWWRKHKRCFTYRYRKKRWRFWNRNTKTVTLPSSPISRPITWTNIWRHGSRKTV